MINGKEGGGGGKDGGFMVFSPPQRLFPVRGGCVPGLTGEEGISEPVHKLREYVSFPVGIVVGQDMCPCCPYEVEVKCQVVDRSYLHGKEFLGLEEMMNIRACIYMVYAACSPVVERCEVVGPFSVPAVDDAIPGENLPVASVPCGHYAVKHVYAAFNGFEDVGGGAHSH